MSKKTIILCVALILALTLGLGGTLAYLTDTDADVNVMVMGDVKITQNEQQRVDQGDHSAGVEAFEQYKSLLPAIYIDGQPKTDLTVGDYVFGMRNDTMKNYVDKIVSVTNTGSNDAFVRTIIAVPTGEVDYVPETASDNWLHYNVIADEDSTPANGWYYGESSSTLSELKIVDGKYPAEMWSAELDIIPGVTIEGIEYDLLVATNKNVVKPGETTAPNLVGLYLDSRVDKDENGYFIKLTPTDEKHRIKIDDPANVKILVASQAVQSEGFEETGAWYALDAAFGDISSTNHPWVNGMPEVGSPGDKSPTNNPVGETISVSTAAEFSDAISKAEEGDVLVVSEDIDFGNNTTKIEKKITVDMNGKTLSSAARNGTLYLTNGASIKNGTIKHNGTVAGIKVWQATSIENITIELAGKSGSNNTITGISVQEGTGTYIKSMKNVTIISTGDNMVYNGLETYNCGNRTDYAIGNMENVKIDVNGTAFVLSAPAAKATNCEFKGDVIGIDMHLKGVYNVSLELEDCDVSGATGIRVYDEAAYPNPGKLTLTYDGATTIAGGIDTTGVVETAQVTITQK